MSPCQISCQFSKSLTNFLVTIPLHILMQILLLISRTSKKFVNCCTVTRCFLPNWLYSIKRLSVSLLPEISLCAVGRMNFSHNYSYVSDSLHQSSAVYLRTVITMIQVHSQWRSTTYSDVSDWYSLLIIFVCFRFQVFHLSQKCDSKSVGVKLWSDLQIK